MRKLIMGGWADNRTGKLSPEDDKYVQAVRQRAIALGLCPNEIGRPERRDEILEILDVFCALTTPPPYGPPEVGKLVDYNITAALEQGMSLEQAVPYARKYVAKTLSKKLATVKSAHVRFGTQGVAKLRKLPR